MPSVTPPIVAAYYYPGYHRCPARNSRGGDTEWNLSYDAVARAAYPDVRRPVAGPVPTTEAVLEAETAQAQSYGIDAFFWCWYWDRGNLIFNEALEMYAACRKPPGFQYALLWVNKRPHFNLPMDRVPTTAESNARLVTTDEADFAAMVDHLIEHHFRRPDYLRVDDEPVLAMFVIEPLVRQLGAARLKRMLADGNARARRAGLRGIHYTATWHRVGSAKRRWLSWAGLGRWAGDAPLADIGFAAVTNYVFLPEWEGAVEQPYDKLVDQRAADWPTFGDRFGLPFWPSVTPGWDARVRGTPPANRGDPLPNGHPWAPVVKGETPEAFARLLRHWTRYARQHGPVPVLPVASWNEWTEGHAIAPCDRHGDGMLRALRDWKASLASPVLADPGTAAPGPRLADVTHHGLQREPALLGLAQT